MKLIWRAVYRFYRVMSWLIYWSQRRFTLAGWLVLAALFVTAHTAVDTETLSAYQGFVLMFLLLFMAVIFSWVFRFRYSATRFLPRFGTAGHAFTYRVRTKTLTKKTQRGLMLLENPADPHPSFQEWLARQLAEERKVRSLRLSRPQQRYNPFRIAAVANAPVPPIPPQGEVETQIAVTPLRRGLLRLEGLT